LVAGEIQTAFISYSREDSEFALKLAEDLKAAGAAVWLDQLDIAPGERWARAVEEALNNCPRMLVILSPASVRSKNVEDEITYALDEGKSVIPVLYRECRIPFRLRALQHVDFRAAYDHGLKALLHTVATEADGREADHERELTAGSSNRGRLWILRLPVWAKAAIGVCIILTAALLLYSRWRQNKPHPAPAGEAQEGAQQFAVPATPETDSSPSTYGTGIVPEGAKKGSWTWQKSATKSGLMAITFASPHSGWAVGLNGTILHTSDDDRGWTPRVSGTHATLYSASFVTPQLGWIVGENGTILHTEDGGDTWKQQSSGLVANPSGFPLPDLHSVAFTSQQSGWAVGHDGVMLHTEDGGKTWKNYGADLSINFLSVSFITPESGWAIGSDGTILHTDNSGISWRRQTCDTSYALRSVFFATPRSGWIVSDLGVVLHTDDAGATWKAQTSDALVNESHGPLPSLTSVSFTTAKSGWAVGRDGVILRTADSGVTWRKENSGTKLDLWSVATPTPKSAWAVGHAGAILHWEE
jgi:photosystem II stability/assembly factor-like uncharacterized protein